MAVVAVALSVGAGRVGAGVPPPAKNAAPVRQSDPLTLAIEGLRGREARPSRSAPDTGRPSPPPGSVALRDPKPMRAARPAKVRPAAGAITGLFGEIRGGGRPHGGVDLDGEIGDPVVSAGAGVVVHAGPPPPGMSGYGNVVVINHPDGTQAMYAHLSAISTVAGTVVSPGSLIGAVGVSGSVTGSHLHWEMRIGAAPIDPLAWLAD